LPTETFSVKRIPAEYYGRISVTGHRLLIKHNFSQDSGFRNADLSMLCDCWSRRDETRAALARILGLGILIGILKGDKMAAKFKLQSLFGGSTVTSAMQIQQPRVACLAIMIL
jgi:hypothetical protein